MMASAPFSLTYIQQSPKSLPPPTQDHGQRTEYIWELIRLWRNSLGKIGLIASLGGVLGREEMKVGDLYGRNKPIGLPLQRLLKR